jgi:hypothetical protein
MGVKLTLSLACCPMERPTCSFLAQDFVSCVIGLMDLKMKNILQQLFFSESSFFETLKLSFG